jgi:hypothetical protein
LAWKDAPGGGGGDVNVKVSATDTTAGYLGDKIDTSGVNGVGLVRAIENPGADESLSIRLGDHFLALASTSVYSGATLSVGATTGTFDLSVGEGIFIDSATDLQDTKNTVTPVVIAARTNVTLTNILTQPVTYILVDSTDTIIESSTYPTAQERREAMFIGTVVHSDNVTVNVVNNLQATGTDVVAQVGDVMEALGFFNLTGNKIVANGANLSIDKDTGTAFKRGANFINNKFDPHTLTLTGQISAAFRYRNQDSTEDTNTTVMDPTTYDSAGVTTAVPGNNNATIQRIYIFPSGAIRIQRGQEVFADFADAVDSVGKDSFVVEPNIAANGLLLASIVLKKTATSLQDGAEALIFMASRFGELTSVGSASSTSLQQAYNNSTEPEVITDATRGAFSIRAGSGADTDDVVEITNTAGTQVLALTGEGNINLSGSVDGRDIATDGSKLDGIESGATADQTQTEITTLYFAQVDQVVAGDILVPTSTFTHRWSPADVKAMVDEHSPLQTVADTSEIELTLSVGHELTADIAASSIDESKLDASVNASLDLADSASQVDWAASGAGTIDPSNYTDTDTVYDDTAIQAAVALNTAKTTNANHTGDVTGSTALTISAGAVDIAMLSATGTASGSTYLQGDNTWGTPLEALMIAGSGTTTDLVAGTLVETYRVPYAFVVQDARISLTTAPTGSVVTVDFKVDGVSMFSTLLTIDATEKTSTTAATPAVLTTPSLVIADDAEITIHVTTIGATLAGAGLKATLRGRQQ